jgi:hypothetical protein
VRYLAEQHHLDLNILDGTNIVAERAAMVSAIPPQTSEG